jgi:hypothetical protein
MPNSTARPRSKQRSCGGSPPTFGRTARRPYDRLAWNSSCSRSAFFAPRYSATPERDPARGRRRTLDLLGRLDCRTPRDGLIPTPRGLFLAARSDIFIRTVHDSRSLATSTSLLALWLPSDAASRCACSRRRTFPAIRMTRTFVAKNVISRQKSTPWRQSLSPSWRPLCVVVVNSPVSALALLRPWRFLRQAACS